MPRRERRKGNGVREGRWKKSKRRQESFEAWEKGRRRRKEGKGRSKEGKTKEKEHYESFEA